MAYLSKIPINPLRSTTQALLSNPQALHAAVLGGLAAQPVNERVLWREEVVGHNCQVLVLTQSRPSWLHLVEQAGWPGADHGEAVVRSLDPLIAMLAVGREFEFRVRANPTYTLPRGDSGRGGRGKRVAHVTAEQQIGWFEERTSTESPRWGFTTAGGDGLGVHLVDREVRRFTKGGQQVTLSRVTFGGRLKVTDPELAAVTLARGLGGGKAYGCGLLTLAPVKD